VNTEPLANYLKAVEAYRAGKPRDAEKLIAQSIGLTEPTSYMKNSLKQLCDQDKPNQAIATLLVHQLTGRK
jgi:hypothetical protein